MKRNYKVFPVGLLIFLLIAVNVLVLFDVIGSSENLPSECDPQYLSQCLKIIKYYPDDDSYCRSYYNPILIRCPNDKTR